MTSNLEIDAKQKLLTAAGSDHKTDLTSNKVSLAMNNHNNNNTSGDEDDTDNPEVKIHRKSSTSSTSSSSSSSTSSRDLKSKRWIITLSCLTLILTLALIICYINYRLCCSSLSNGVGGSSQPSSFAFFKCSSTYNRNPNVDGFLSSLPLIPSAPDLDYYDHVGAMSGDEVGRITRLGANGWNSSRLPSHLIPWHYDIRLRINVHSRQFNGYCAIRFRCNQSITFVVVHAESNLQFLANQPGRAPTDYKPRVFELKLGAEANRNEMPVKRWDFNPVFSYYVIQLEDGRFFRKSKNYMIVFESFQSPITNNLKGLYYSTYVAKNQTRTIVVSQLQPLEARRVFPSFDEPILKARFSISIEHHKEFRALSNMEEKVISRLDATWSRTEFETTPLMSTYILAFVVCDFKPLYTTGPNGLKIRVWTRDDYVNNTKYALDSIPKAYEFFEGYFNIREVVNKSDHLASPDFNAGAMENWGLVIYKESALLYDDEKSLLEDEYFVLLVICHEVSHSWFGNMATFKWWDNVWLNEAFANTLMYFAMEQIRPDFNVLETLVVHDIFTVMEKDSLETSHPVSTYVEDPNQVQQYFDEISYEKGLSVLRMLRGFIGDENFKIALRNHVQKYKFSNCDMNDLWKVISETINYKYNISNIMTNWITQEGYPVVNVTMIEDRSRNKIIYELKQSTFLLSQNRQEDKNYKWVIPFTYKFEDTRADDKQLIWLNLTDSRIELDANDRNRRKWIYANLDFMGYFRVNYDEQNWLKIAAQLKRDHNKFTALERATLLFDAFTLARIGYLSYPNTLELSSYLVNEKDYVPWKSFFKSITYLDNMLASSSCYGLFQNYCSKQISPIYKRLGWEDLGNFMERLLRTHVIKYSSYFENSDAVNKAKEKFEKFLNGTKLEKNIVEAVYCAGVKYGTGKDWVFLFNKSLHSIPAEQSVVWQALICSRETWILKGLLETTLNETIIRRSDIRRIYSFYTLTAISRSIYFEFITTNWNTLLNNFGNDAFLMSAILENLSIGVNDVYSLERIKQMLKKGAGAASNSPDFIIDQINSNIKWIKNNEKNICNYLKDTQK